MVSILFFLLYTYDKSMNIHQFVIIKTFLISDYDIAKSLISVGYS